MLDNILKVGTVDIWKHKNTMLLKNNQFYFLLTCLAARAREQFRAIAHIGPHANTAVSTRLTTHRLLAQGTAIVDRTLAFPAQFYLEKWPHGLRLVVETFAPVETRTRGDLVGEGSCKGR